jgi:hypothetical protein
MDALAAFVIFLPQSLFVPLLQRAINQRSGTRVQVLRQLGIGIIDQTGDLHAEDIRLEHIFQLDMGIFRLKFTMNVLMNLSNICKSSRLCCSAAGGCIRTAWRSVVWSPSPRQ